MKFEEDNWREKIQWKRHLLVWRQEKKEMKKKKKNIIYTND